MTQTAADPTTRATGEIEFRIFDRHRVPALSIVFAKSWREAKQKYRAAAYPDRKALPSGIKYERIKLASRA